MSSLGDVKILEQNKIIKTVKQNLISSKSDLFLNWTRYCLFDKTLQKNFENFQIRLITCQELCLKLSRLRTSLDHPKYEKTRSISECLVFHNTQISHSFVCIADFIFAIPDPEHQNQSRIIYFQHTCNCKSTHTQQHSRGSTFNCRKV